MNKSRSCVVILNWNAQDETLECLANLIENGVLEEQIVVVDNGSRDDSRTVLLSKYPDLTYIWNSTNLGFAGGVNCGIRKSMEMEFEYTALLNNDARIEKKWLESMVDVLNNEKSVGIVGSKMLRTDRIHIDTTGDTYSTWGFAHPRGRDEVDLGQYNNREDVFAASGGACLLRNNMLREIGLFDESFFAYFEDVDLSFRAHLAGWRVVYEPRSVAIHKVGATSSKIGGFTMKQAIQNLPLLYFKNIPRSLFLRTYWKFLVGHSLLFLATLRKKDGIRAAFFGFFGAVRLFPSALKSRRVIQARSKVSPQEILQLMSTTPPHHISKFFRKKV